MNWFLIINVIAGGWGQVYYAEYKFPSQAACFEALSKVQVLNPGQVAQGERGQTTIISCLPKEPVEKAKK